jgi:ABC-type sugar transport system ATPase subunit
VTGTGEPPAQDAPLVELRSVGHRYDGAPAWALRDVSLAVGPGRILAVVGPSGSGKSTLLRVVCGLLAAHEGRVVVDGTDVTSEPPERRPVAMVFQGFALFPHLTVRENIAFGPRVRRERGALAPRVEATAARLGLTEVLDRFPRQLAGGERQRTALARALIRSPRVCCLDEPLASLDPRLRTDARRLLAEVLRADGRCAVHVTHDQAEAMTVGDAVAVLDRGTVRQVGTPRDVYDRPADTFVASFVGSPPMNLLGDTAAARAGLLGGRLARAVPPGGSVGVRPEDVTLGPGGPGGEAVVRDLEDVGHEVHVLVDCAGEVVLARVPHGGELAPGRSVALQVAPEKVRIFASDGRLLR